jgi:hypothetical protein
VAAIQSVKFCVQFFASHGKSSPRALVRGKRTSPRDRASCALPYPRNTLSPEIRYREGRHQRRSYSRWQPSCRIGFSMVSLPAQLDCTRA